MAPAAYVGPVIYNETDKFKKVDFADIDKLAADPTRKPPYTKNADNGWVGMIEHYFVAAWLPSDEKKTPREFYARKLDDGLYTAGVIVPVGTDRAGRHRRSRRVPLYVGPQDQDVLAKTRARASTSSSTTASSPCSRRRCSGCCKWLHGLIGNWGWAIVVMTIIIKRAFYPLNARGRALDGAR